MVDQISLDFEEQPVVFLEQYHYDDHGDRRWRMYTAIPGPTYSWPLVIVESGNQWSEGPTDYNTTFRGLVDSELERAPTGSLSVSRQRVGDTFEFSVAVTNETGTALSSANSATVHAIVFEDAPAGVARVTDRFVRAADYTSIASLDDGATDTFDLVVDLSGVTVDWGALHSVVIVDYRPGGATGPYDSVQAAFQP